MKRITRSALATVTFGGLFGSELVAQTANNTPPKSDVPVRSVMLFSSGVGFFEHAGSVRGDGATELRFKTAQINDILKSLVLQDQDGGRVTAITYPSQDPVSKTLRSFQVDITANPSLAGLLNQLRGARVTIQSRTERISGSVMGVEMRTEISTSNKATETPVLNLLTGATIRAIELPSISSLSLDDPHLQDELTKALSALSQARDKDKKPVTINFSGTGDRRVRIGYLVETPIWKTSYRLLLDEKVNRVQGWAIVENQTESDWNDVSLSLVSGRPMSFMMDLYQPLYLTRPTVTQELFAGLRPRVYDAGVDGAADSILMQSSESGGGRGGSDAARARDFAKAEASRMGDTRQLSEVAVTGAPGISMAALQGRVGGTRVNYADAVQSRATGSKMGELFQYAVGNVTLARQKSAMLPIIADSISIERLSIYNATVLESNPLNGVRLRNTTGKHLLEGPVTVLDQNRYAGDAQINSVPPGQERLLSYGIDLEMVMDRSKVGSTYTLVSGRIVKGALFVERKLVETREYRVENKGEKDKVLLVEHPSRVRNGFSLVGTQKPAETTDEHYRFQGLAPAKKVTVLVVKEENVQSQAIAIMPADINTLLSYSKTGEFSAKVREELGKAISLKQTMIDTERLLGVRTQQVAEITAEQNRMRENMKTVAQNTAYYKRLLEKLNDQESQLEKLASERDELRAKRDAERKELEAYLNTLTAN